MIVFDSPFLDTSVSLEKNDLNNVLRNIAEDIELNLQTLNMSQNEQTEAKQKKIIVKNIIERLDKTPNKNISKQLTNHKWLQSLVDDQLINQNIHTFGNYVPKNQQNKIKKTTRKRVTPMTWISSEKPSIDMTVPSNKRKSINSAKKLFSNIVGNVPPESYNKFNIEYSPQENLQIMDQDEF